MALDHWNVRYYLPSLMSGPNQAPETPSNPRGPLPSPEGVYPEHDAWLELMFFRSKLREATKRQASVPALPYGSFSQGELTQGSNLHIVETAGIFTQ